MKILRVVFWGAALLQLSGCYVLPDFSTPQPIEQTKPLVEAPKEPPAPAPAQAQRKIVVEVNINEGTGQASANVSGEPEIIYAPSCIPKEKTTAKPKQKKKPKKPKPKKPVC